MAFDIWARAQLKWRGILVYTLLQAITRFVTQFIYTQSTHPALQLYASLVLLATTCFCLHRFYQLLTLDRDGDDAWPPIWS
jgi:hypothetical protein